VHRRLHFSADHLDWLCESLQDSAWTLIHWHEDISGEKISVLSDVLIDACMELYVVQMNVHDALMTIMCC